MIALCVVLAILATLLICLTTFVQLLYLESLRLRARETPALEFFRDTLEERLGLKPERGTLVFSLLKHTLLVLLGVMFLAISSAHGGVRWQTLIEAGLVGWLTMLVSAYLAPQILLRKTSARWLLPLTGFVRVLALLVQPLVWFFGFLQSIFEIGNDDAEREDGANATEHIEALITAGAEEGIIEEEDRKLIQSVMAFGDKTVREVMTPRPNIVAIEQGRSLEELRELVIHEQYSRVPVYEGNIDNVIGFIHVRDMFELDTLERTRRKVRELLRPISSVPETKKVDDLLREMQEDGVHMAIVIDEYGNTAGLVTMEDLVEEILGEIRDEHEPTRDVTPDGDGCIVSGSFDLDGLEDLFGFRPTGETESTTVGGLVTEWFGRVPVAGETLNREGIHIEVLSGNERRVDQVRISKATAEKADV